MSKHGMYTTYLHYCETLLSLLRYHKGMSAKYHQNLMTKPTSNNQSDTLPYLLNCRLMDFVRVTSAIYIYMHAYDSISVCYMCMHIHGGACPWGCPLLWLSAHAHTNC